MRARQRIDGDAFGPDALKVIGQAFDAAWAEIADKFDGDPLAVEVARLKFGHDFDGDPGRIRTCDPLIRNQVLYPLSYGASSIVAFAILVLGIITLGATIAPFRTQVSSMAHWRKKRARSQRLCSVQLG